MSFLHLGFGDPAASLFGVLYGNRCGRIGKNKSIVGMTAAFLTCVACTAVYGGVVQPWLLLAGPSGFVSMCILCGVAGAAAEALDIGGLDDNLTIPLVAGLLSWWTVSQVGGIPVGGSSLQEALNG